jgi:CubicO group peptidase (beta-lactamase class C family)
MRHDPQGPRRLVADHELLEPNRKLGSTMDSNKLMAEFPSADDAQVTLANWRKKPFNEWGFRNVRELLPTANIARSDSAVALPSRPQYLEDVSFEGIDGQTTLGRGLHAFDADGVLVLHRGEIVWEQYDHGMTPSTQHVVFSVTKSFTGSLCGILAEAGKLHPDDLVVKYLPELKGSAYSDCTIRHLLDMSVGIKFEEDYLKPDGDVARYRNATGWDVGVTAGLPSPHLREFLQSQNPDGSAHGEKFHYVSVNTDTLGWLYERACGMSYAKILQHYLWAPMGAEYDAYITLDSRGAARAAGGLCASVRDLARFGELMRNNGVSSTGRQVVPSWWIVDIRNNGNSDAWARGEYTVLFPNGNYRSKWYTPDRSRTAFCAIGIHGQYVYVDPQDETVIVRVSSQPIPFEVENDLAWIRACRAITARLAAR